jgi:hypothetical protein
MLEIKKADYLGEYKINLRMNQICKNNSKRGVILLECQ